jgi:hypothetical protein
VFGERDSGFAWLYSRKLASFFGDIMLEHLGAARVCVRTTRQRFCVGIFKKFCVFFRRHYAWGQPASVFGERDSGFAWLYSRKLASFFEDIRQKLCLNIWGQPASVFGERDSVFAWLYSRKLASCFEEIRQKLASFFGEMLTKSSAKVHQMLTDFGRRNVDVS